MSPPQREPCSPYVGPMGKNMPRDTQCVQSRLSIFTSLELSRALASRYHHPKSSSALPAEFDPSTHHPHSVCLSVRGSVSVVWCPVGTHHEAGNGVTRVAVLLCSPACYPQASTLSTAQRHARAGPGPDGRSLSLAPWKLTSLQTQSRIFQDPNPSLSGSAGL